MSLFESVRKLTIPFDKIFDYVPQKGTILDVGCGHGAFSRMIAVKRPQTSILGIDPSNHKISLAKKHRLKNLKYQIGYLKDVTGSFDCIIFMDVLYLFSPEEKIKAFQSCKKLLKKNGSLIISEIDPHQGLIFKFLELEEVIMVKLLKYTYADDRNFYFWDKKSYTKTLKQAGFKSIQTQRVHGFLPYQHFLYIVK